MSYVEGIVWPQASQMCCDTPPLLERTYPGSIFFSGRRRRGRSWWQKRYSSGFVVRVECIIIGRRVCRFPTIECADIHGWRWDGRWIRRVWWLGIVSIVVVIACVFYHCHGCQDLKRVGRQVQVIQARWDNWELPSKSIWHRRLIGIIINGKYMRLGRCYRRDWGHRCRMMLR